MTDDFVYMPEAYRCGVCREALPPASRGRPWCCRCSPYAQQVRAGLDAEARRTAAEREARRAVVDDRPSRMAHGRKAAAAKGLWMGRTPFGYAKGPDGHLVPDENAGHVRWIFKRVARGDTLQQVLEELNERGVPTPGRGKSWSRPAVSWLIQSDAYLGVVTHGPDVRVERAHPALVGRRVAERAREGLAKRRRGS